MPRQSAIISDLERAILPLQGVKKMRSDIAVNIGCPGMEQAFPNKVFPIGCTHELITKNFSDLACTNGFIAALLGKLLSGSGVCLWISTARTVFPPALAGFAVKPEQVIFIDLKKERDVLYATEEALKCNKLVAVVADMSQVSFKESRRFQLAAEQSRVTGFIVRHHPRVTNTIASVSRWQISALPSRTAAELPGVGFPRWKVELQKIRNGIPSSWIIEWSYNDFHIIRENRQVVTWYEGLRKIS